MVLFTQPSERLCWTFMRSTDCPSSYPCIYPRIYNACKFSNGTESEVPAVTRWAAW